MPTPVQAFAEVAAKHGGVDPSDMDAVRRFYRETLPTLGPETIEAILEELLAREGCEAGDGPEPFYPGEGRLPRLAASPPVVLPLLACGWRRLFARLRLRRRGHAS